MSRRWRATLSRIALRALGTGIAALGIVAIGAVAAPARAADAAPGASAPVDQSVPGTGNAAAERLAAQSPLVRSSLQRLVAAARGIRDRQLRAETLALLQDPHRCVAHRRGLATQEAQDEVIRRLREAGLLNDADAAGFAPGVRAGIFPPLLDADGDCPQLPQSMRSAPGSVSGGHHSYPGGLVVHESNNELSDQNLAAQYRGSYGAEVTGGLPIDDDVIRAAPIWHDWAKTLVFQWNADGSEFAEFNFGGNGATDAWGAAGDARTAGHHLLSIAEAMARGLSPIMVVTQASAHAAPTLGNEWKVVDWLRAAAIIARVDPVKAGYLGLDAAGHLRLPAIGPLDLNAAGQTNLRVEYALHNLSDADYTFSGPSVGTVDALLRTLGPEFGHDPASLAAYTTGFRNPVLSWLSAERLLVLHGHGGIGALRAELQRLRKIGVI